MNPDTQAHAPQSEEEIDLMDLLLILSENLKSLILLPVLGLLLASGFIYWKLQSPKSYVSTSSIFVEAPNGASKVRAEVLVSAINTGDTFKDIAAKGVSINASLGHTDRFVNITATASSPSEVQSSNQAVLEKLFQITVLPEAEVQRLQTLLSNEQQRLTEAQKLIAETTLSHKSSPEAIQSYSALLELASNREFAINKIQNQLSGLSMQDVVQAPTLPTTAQPIKKAIPLLAGFIGGGFLALLWIFVRHALSTVRTDPVQRQKWSQIKSNLGLKDSQ